MEDNIVLNDHDLLIRLCTQVERLISDVNVLSTNLVDRVEKLESGKTDCAATEKMRDNIQDLQKWRWVIIGIGILSTMLISLIIYVYTTEQGKQDARIDWVAKTIEDVMKK